MYNTLFLRIMKAQLKRGFRVSRYIIYKETSVEPTELFWSFLGSFTGIACIGLIQSQFFTLTDNIFLIGSFGATGVLIYGAIQSPLAQPRNLIGGHLISAFIGVSVFHLVGDVLWLGAALAVSLSIIVMQLSKTLHPPGGATALIAVIGSEKITGLSYAYVFFPVLTGVCIMLFIALIFNNLTPNRKYPTDGRFSRTIKWIAGPTKSSLKKLRMR